MHRAFMAEIGEEMCQAEVAHHANRCPEYFCSRPEKSVHLYKKALALNVRTKEPAEAPGADQWAGDGNDDEEARVPAPKRLATQPSDLELYERRCLYDFWPEDTPITSRLPAKKTSKEQVFAASLYEFFRLVQFHGGRHAHFTWHPADAMPIVMLSPVLKLREGPDFAFGARWALMQHCSWQKRTFFLEMPDEETQQYFRDWIDTPECPWYVREQYLSETSRPLRPAKEQIRKENQNAEENVEAAHGADEDDVGEEVLELERGWSVTEESNSEKEQARPDDDTHVLRMLYKGNMEEVSRREEASRKAKLVNR